MDPTRVPVRSVDGGSPERLAVRDAGGARAIQTSDSVDGARACQASDRRAPSAIGRHARLELAFEQRRGRTMLTHGYAEPPLRIGRVFDLNGAAYVILVCAGPGLFGGDTLTQSIHVAAGARVVLTSQAALQIHPLPELRSPAPAPGFVPSFPQSANPATLDWSIVVECGGELHCQWDPVIPFAGAHVEQRFNLQIAGDSALYWSDALIAGRISRGEAWQFAALGHEIAVRVDGRTAYLERYRIAPHDRVVQRTWMAGQGTHFGTTIVRHPAATRETVEELHRRLAGVHGVAAAVDLVEPSLAVARVMSADGASFRAVRASYRAWTLASIFGRPELAGRK